MTHFNFRINQTLHKHTRLKSRTYPWPDLLLQCVHFQLSKMYLQLDRSVNYQSTVCYFAEQFAEFSPSLEIKRHFEKVKLNRSILDNSLEYKNKLKRRKYARESALRGSVEGVEGDLSRLEEILRKRRSSEGCVLSISALLNDSTNLVDTVYEEKCKIVR